jgi:hypothetical protein
MIGKIQSSKNLKLWNNKPLWLFYLYQLKPEEGPRPDAESFIKIEEQYAIFYKENSGYDGPTKLKEPDIDRALDIFNKKLEDWKNGTLEARSVGILVNEEALDTIAEVESYKGFAGWMQPKVIEEIKFFIE